MVFTEFVGTVISVVLAVVSETEVGLRVVLELRGSSPARGIVDVVFVVVEAVVVQVIIFQKLLFKKSCRLRCLLRVKDLAICFYFGWSGSILYMYQKQIRNKGRFKDVATCSNNITLRVPSYTVSAL